MSQRLPATSWPRAIIRAVRYYGVHIRPNIWLRRINSVCWLTIHIHRRRRIRHAWPEARIARVADTEIGVTVAVPRVLVDRPFGNAMIIRDGHCAAAQPEPQCQKNKPSEYIHSHSLLYVAFIALELFLTLYHILRYMSNTPNNRLFPVSKDVTIACNGSI